MRRVHFSDQPVALQVGRTYEQVRRGYKPRGLWYSVEGGRDGWSDWCEAEDYRVEHLRCPHALAVSEQRILLIRTGEELRRFYDRFCCSLEPYPEPWYIDWQQVAELYAGIEIAPYQWEFRLALNYTWYYTWDCASGCIWDLSVVEAFELLELADTCKAFAADGTEE